MSKQSLTRAVIFFLTPLAPALWAKQTEAHTIFAKREAKASPEK